jgi:hypothetical protein
MIKKIFIVVFIIIFLLISIRIYFQIKNNYSNIISYLLFEKIENSIYKKKYTDLKQYFKYLNENIDNIENIDLKFGDYYFSNYKKGIIKMEANLIYSTDMKNQEIICKFIKKRKDNEDYFIFHDIYIKKINNKWIIIQFKFPDSGDRYIKKESY